MYAHVFSLDYDMLDVAKAVGTYFLILAVYVMNNYYLGNEIIKDWGQWFIIIGAFTHVVMPMLNFTIMLILGQYIKQRLYKT
jgi:hypothetical protein